MMDRVVVTDGGVCRPAGWWTPTVHALLRHLRSVGFSEAPEPLGLEEGMETLS
jgi:hypothetical protein